MAAHSQANFGNIRSTSNYMILVPLLNPKFAIECAAGVARTSGSGHEYEGIHTAPPKSVPDCAGRRGARPSGPARKAAPLPALSCPGTNNWHPHGGYVRLQIDSV